MNGADVKFGALAFCSRYEGMTDAEVLERAVAVAELAEAVGFDSVWCTEHHFTRFGVNPSATTLGAFLLGRTSTIGVGTAVTLLPTHAPVEVAEQAALLDQLSGGRFSLGVGRGGPVVDYEVLGRSLEHWRHGLEEALDLVLASFAGPVSAESDLYRFREVRPIPAPRTAPHPPVLVAATSEIGVRLAGERGLPMLMFFDQSDGAKADAVRQHAEIAAANGRPVDGYAHGFAVFAHVTETAEEAQELVLRKVLPFLAASRAEYVLLEERGNPRDEESALADFPALVLGSHPIGPPAVCIERLVTSLRTSGCPQALLNVELAGDLDETLGNVRRLGEDVLPAVRAELG